MHAPVIFTLGGGSSLKCMQRQNFFFFVSDIDEQGWILCQMFIAVSPLLVLWASVTETENYGKLNILKLSPKSEVKSFNVDIYFGDKCKSREIPLTSCDVSRK